MEGVELETPEREELFHDWLAELNYLHQTRQEVYHRFEVLEISDKRIEAQVIGEPISPPHHEIDVEIKAVTYHQLTIKQSEQGWEAFVIFDV